MARNPLLSFFDKSSFTYIFLIFFPILK